MKKEYNNPKLEWILIELPDLLTLSNGGEGDRGMGADWGDENSIK